MNKYDSDSEDITDSSIYDLDSAPPPPSDHGTFLSSAATVTSPSRQQRTRWHTPAPLQNAMPMRRRAHTSFLPGRNNSAPISPMASSPPSRLPARISSWSGSGGSALPSARSFPPPHQSKSPGAKQVAFANSRDSEEAMLHIPEIDDDDFIEDDDLDEEEIIDRVDEANARRKEQQQTDHSNYDPSQSSELVDEESTSSQKFVKLCGYPLPSCWCVRQISWNRVAVAIVNRSPCFACRRLTYNTYRAVLERLNILCAFFASGQLVSTLWLCIILQSPSLVDRDVANQTELETRRRENEFEVLTNVWNLNGAVWFLGFLAFVVLLSIGLTIRIIRDVNLVGAVRFLWVILWVLPLQAAMVVGLFDYFLVTDVWIKFWWRDKTMAWFRHKFCQPAETANTLCAVPRYVSDSEEAVRIVRNGVVPLILFPFPRTVGRTGLVPGKLQCHELFRNKE